jgi:EmrB/QacA subfamily drug resistance transporter
MTSRPPNDHQPYPAYKNRWFSMAIVLMASFMNLLDVTIVNVSLPTLQHDMGASASDIEWVVAGFILTFALGLLPFGRYGDIVGKKLMFLIGVGAFTIASILCGIAPNIEFLIGARLLQGAAGAIMTPQVLAIAQTIFPPHERSIAFSLFGLTAGMASVIGPVLGGLLLAADIGGLQWRPIFLMNVPIGILALVLGAKFIPKIPGNPGMKNDFGGIAIVSAAMLLLIFPLIEGRNFAWAPWCFAMIAAALVLFVAFVFWERRQNEKGAPQLLPIGLMQNRNFVIGACISLAFFSATPPFFLVLALYLQSGYGLEPLWSGLLTAPFSVGVLVSSAISGRLGFRWQRQRIVGGIVLMILGITALRFAVGSLGESLHFGVFVVPLFLTGVGLGVVMASLFQTILAGVPVKDAGSGSGALQAIQQSGGALGVAIVSEIFFRTLAAQFAAGAQQIEAFRASLMTAVIYNLVAYVFVIVCVLALKNPPRTGMPGGAPAAPVMAD